MQRARTTHLALHPARLLLLLRLLLATATHKVLHRLERSSTGNIPSAHDLPNCKTAHYNSNSRSDGAGVHLIALTLVVHLFMLLDDFLLIDVVVVLVETLEEAQGG